MWIDVTCADKEPPGASAGLGEAQSAQACQCSAMLPPAIPKSDGVASPPTHRPCVAHNAQPLGGTPPRPSWRCHTASRRSAAAAQGVQLADVKHSGAIAGPHCQVPAPLAEAVHGFSSLRWYRHARHRPQAAQVQQLDLSAP